MSLRMILLSLFGLFVLAACGAQTQRWYGELEVANEEPLVLRNLKQGWERELESGRYMIDWIPNVRERSGQIILYHDGSYQPIGELEFSWAGRMPLSSLNLSAVEIGQDFDIRARIQKGNSDRVTETRRESCRKTGYCYTCMNILGEYKCDYQLSNQCPGYRTVRSTRESWEETLEIQFLEPGTNSEKARFTSDPIERYSDTGRTETGQCL